MQTYLNAVRDGDFQNPWNSASGAGAVTSYTVPPVAEEATETRALTPDWVFDSFAALDCNMPGFAVVRNTSPPVLGALPTNLRTAFKVTSDGTPGSTFLLSTVKLTQRDVRVRQFDGSPQVYVSFWAYSESPGGFVLRCTLGTASQDFQIATEWRRYGFFVTPAADVADLIFVFASGAQGHPNDYQNALPVHITGVSVSPEVPPLQAYYRNRPASQELVALQSTTVNNTNTTIPHGLGVEPTYVMVLARTAITPRLISKSSTNIVLIAATGGTADLIFCRP